MVKAYSEAIEERMQKFNTGKEAQQKASNVGLESRPNDVRLNFTSTLKHANVVLACKIIDLFSTLANIKARSDSEYSSSDASRDEINLFKSKKSGVPVLQEDIDALARWMLYEPRASYSSARKYFSKFQTQVRWPSLDPTVLRFVDKRMFFFSGTGVQGLQMGGIGRPEYMARPSRNECNKLTQRKRLS